MTLENFPFAPHVILVFPDNSYPNIHLKFHESPTTKLVIKGFTIFGPRSGKSQRTATSKESNVYVIKPVLLCYSFTNIANNEFYIRCRSFTLNIFNVYLIFSEFSSSLKHEIKSN